MRLLLGENFPLRLSHELRARGFECDHVIELGLRGISDSEIINRLEHDPELVLLTQDADFEDVAISSGAVLISRVPQALPIAQRVDVWLRAIETLVDPSGIVEIRASGEVRAVRD